MVFRITEVITLEKSVKPRMKIKPSKYLRKESKNGNVRYVYKEPKSIKNLEGSKRVIERSKHLLNSVKEIGKLVEHYDDLAGRLLDRSSMYGEKAEWTKKDVMYRKFTDIADKYDELSDRANNIRVKLLRESKRLNNKLFEYSAKLDDLAGIAWDAGKDKLRDKLTDLSTELERAELDV